MPPNEPDARPPPPEGDGGEAGGRKPFLLRLPAPLMAELRGWAAHDLRSLNAHIEYLLREAVKARQRSQRPPRP